ncbi:uncharacterized protein METZ01_LOCUS35980 [marine metagenome]|uniref:Uncharacterized protein n=1 Tax=marine metagenome TaxID=408172 RepID=A0A381QUN5_9ZZZZ
MVKPQILDAGLDSEETQLKNRSN